MDFSSKEIFDFDANSNINNKTISNPCLGSTTLVALLAAAVRKSLVQHRKSPLDLLEPSLIDLMAQILANIRQSSPRRRRSFHQLGVPIVDLRAKGQSTDLNTKIIQCSASVADQVSASRQQ